MQNKTSTALHDLIMVKDPYYKLYGVEVIDSNSVRCKVKNDFLSDTEGGPMGIGEAGRHLAILGSMSVAHSANFEVPKFYLAYYADFKRGTTNKYDSEEFTLVATCKEVSKRKASIHGVVYDADEQEVFQGAVDYQILDENMFGRFFSSKKIDFRFEELIDPYIDRRKLVNLTIDNYNASAVYGEVYPQECLGHFQSYPALPVAVVGNLFIELATELFMHHNPNVSKVVVQRAIIKADRLAFHKEWVTFTAEILEIGQLEMKIHCKAYSNKEEFSSIDIWLKS